MKFRSLLGLLAAVGMIVGVMVLGSGSALADGSGPTIDISATVPVCSGCNSLTNTVVLGSGNVNVIQASTTTAVDAWSGYNASFVRDSSKLANAAINDLTTPGAWGGPSLCLNAVNSNFLGSLTPPLLGDIITCSRTAPGVATSTYIGGIASDVLTPLAVGVTAVHMVEPLEAGPGAGTFASYTINDADTDIQNDTYSCTAGGVTVPGNSGLNPLCPIIPPSPFNSVAIQIINPPPDISVTKTASPASFVAGQAASYTITVNNPSSTTAATGVVVTDNLPAAMTGAVTFSGPGAGSCSVAGPPNAQVVTCNVGTIAASGSFTVTVNIASTDGSAGGTQPDNDATATLNEADPNLTNNTGHATVSIIPPAVAWTKVNTCGTGNVWLAENNNPLQSVGECVGPNMTFNEVMINQGDTAGLGGFSFDLYYDPTQYTAPSINFAPAIALFAAAGRTLDCTITNPQNGVIHAACASTGAFGSGPSWVGAQVMANVTLTTQDLLVEALRPNKENGDLSVVKDSGVTVVNTCGQPLNDGSIQPLPGQPECQGVNLQGVGPGGVLTGNPNGGQLAYTIRRLEGDTNSDCSVDVLDMQAEAMRFGTSTGSLLYRLWYDVNSPLQHGDGEIDINDVQFVYGRFGSECSAPIPAQPPATP